MDDFVIINEKNFTGVLPCPVCLPPALPCLHCMQLGVKQVKVLAEQMRENLVAHAILVTQVGGWADGRASGRAGLSVCWL